MRSRLTQAHPTLTIARIMKAARCSSDAAVRALPENSPPRLQPRLDHYRAFTSFEEYLNRTYAKPPKVTEEQHP